MGLGCGLYLRLGVYELRGPGFCKLRLKLGMLTLIRTVLNRDYSTPVVIPTKDCSYKREPPKHRTGVGALFRQAC